MLIYTTTKKACKYVVLKKKHVNLFCYWSHNSNKLLLLHRMDKTTDIGLILMLNFLSFLLRYNWYYHTLPQAHMDNRVMYWPRGRVLGGSSSLNAMVYIRGHAEDYNRWQREGAEGWDYEHCLPYFRRAQCHELGENRYLTAKTLMLFEYAFGL